MRKLHLVGLTTDRDGMIFTARKGSKSGGYIVPLDDKVLDAVAEAESARNGTDIRPDGRGGDADRRGGRSASALTPREMQARLRAGRTIAEVAAEAGVDNEWVARFAVPILAEQAQVVELARGLTYAKPRLGESSQPLGASVVQNLSDKGVFLPDDLADAGWSAFQLHDSVWMVRFRYRSRGRDQEAQWEIDVPAARLLARNRHASDLGYVEADRRRRSLVADEDEPEDPAAPPPRRTTSPAGRARKARTAKAAPPVRPSKSRPTLPRSATARPAGKAGKATRAARQARPATSAPPKTARATKSDTSTKAAKAIKGAKGAFAPATSPPVKAGGGKAPAKRRPPKAGAVSEVGPAGGTGGVRLAVARVSTARVAASLASADRAPWAAAVRTRPGARPTPPAPHTLSSNGGERPGSRRSAGTSDRGGASPERGAADRNGPAFQPRPLPEGVELEGPRPRRPPPPRPKVPKGEPPPVSLPAPRPPAPAAGPIPSERPKRRRLRAR